MDETNNNEKIWLTIFLLTSTATIDCKEMEFFCYYPSTCPITIDPVSIRSKRYTVAYAKQRQQQTKNNINIAFLCESSNHSLIIRLINWPLFHVN